VRGTPARPLAARRWLVESIAWAAVLLLFAGTMTAVANSGTLLPGQGGEPSTGGGDPGPQPGGTVVETTVVTKEVLPAGQAKVAGSASVLTVDGAVLDGVATPLTADVPERGLGRAGAVIENAIVDGQRATISWDSGRPLVIEGAGAIAVGPVGVSADPQGSTVSFGEGTHGIAPAAYRIATPVAVGTSGLAEPREGGVSFTADAATTITFSGGAFTRVPPGVLRLRGEGKVAATGDFGVTERSEQRTAPSLDFGPGAYDVTVTPGTAGLTVAGTLEGPLRLP